MTNLADKTSRYAHYDYLNNLDDNGLEKAIDEEIGIVTDEFKSFIEHLTCNSKIHSGILDSEARFEYALANLKSLIWRKYCK